MNPETGNVVERIKKDPLFHELVRKRNNLAWLLTILMFLIYFGFVATVAFNRELLDRHFAGDVTTIGIPIGLGVIISAFLLTGLYVLRANSAFDEITKKLLEKVKK